MTIYVWKASRGREIPVHLMTDEHLINAINWLERLYSRDCVKVPNPEQRSDGYFWLRQEAMKRGLRWRNYTSYPPLRDGDLVTNAVPPHVHVGERMAEHERKRQYQFPTFEDIARGLGGVEPPQARRHDAIPLRDLKSGEKFKVPGRSQIYLKTEPYGVTESALYSKGYCWDGSYFVCDDGADRCFVANLRSGKTYLEDAHRVVTRYEGHRIG